MIKAVIFDMDGVIIDSEPLWREAEIFTFNKVGLEFTEEMCRETMGMRLYEVVQYWYSKTPWQGSSLETVEKNLLKKVTELIIDKGASMDGVSKAIEFFQSKGLKIALASSSALTLIETVLKKLHLTNEFEVVNSAEFLSYGKPNPEIFIKTANDLNVKPFECLVIEDSFHGVLAAKSALMKVVAIPDDENRTDPRFCIANHILRSLKEIETISIE